MAGPRASRRLRTVARRRPVIRSSLRTGRAPLGADIAFVGCVFVCLLACLAGCASAPPPTTLERAEAALLEGRFDAAATLYDEARRADPTQTSAAMHGLGRVALAKGRPDQAIVMLEKLARVDRAYFSTYAAYDYTDALLDAGRDRFEKERGAREAVDLLEKAYRFAPGHPGVAAALAEAHTSRGEHLAIRGQRTRALVHFERARSLRPRNADAWVGAAEILIGANRKPDALALLSEARHLYPADGRVRSLVVQAMGVY